jgi:outer membrane lipoprotein-sorting protein
MIDRKHYIMLAGLFALVIAAPALAQSLDDVEKKIVEAADKVKSFTADMTMESEMQQGGRTMAHRGKGTIEVVRRGDKMLSRMEQKITMDTGAGGQKMEVSTLTVIDEEYMYMLTEQFGQKMAMKRKPDPGQMRFAGKSMFEELRKEHDLKLLPEAQVEGRDAYVIEATPKNQTGPVAKQVSYFDKQTGLVLKMAALDAAGKAMHTTTFSNYKTNVEIDPDHFKFKAPEGVQIMDMTNMPAPKQP